MEFFDLYRKDRWPHMFCPGCGIGTVMNCFHRAFSDSGLDLDRTVFVSGIGCSSRIIGYIRGDSMHTTHGRSIPVATGIRLSDPELRVIVFGGDGDLGAIGGNHLINAARRNADMAVFCINNSIYGMTGGQASTSTPHMALSTTTPWGNREYPFDLSELAATSGANYVARWTVRHIRELTRSMMKAMLKPGFSFVEIASPCPTSFGRRNDMANVERMYDWLEERSMTKEEACDLDLDPIDVDMTGKIIVGEIIERQRPPLVEVMRSMGEG